MKKAIVTGANKGIGYALVKELKSHGYEVSLGARNPDLGNKAAKELGTHFLQFDVTDPASIKKAFEEYSSKNDSLDLLINNAGIYLLGKDGIASEATIEGVKILSTLTSSESSMFHRPSSHFLKNQKIHTF